MLKFITFKNQILSIVFRVMVIFCKFFLVTNLVEILPLGEFGEYSLLVNSISYCLIIIGVDFHSFSVRFLPTVEFELWKSYLKDIFIFYTISYVFFSGIFLILFVLDILSMKYIFWFYLILWFEHLSQELYRILVLLNRTVKADFLVFLRNGIWIFPALYLMKYNFNKDVSVVFFCWALGVMSSLIIGVYWLLNELPKQSIIKPINWQNIKTGFRISFFFFLGTISFCSITTFDKYIIKNYTNSSEVGVYSFFYMLIGVIITLVEVGIINHTLPKLIKANYNNDKVLYNSLHKTMLNHIVIVVVVFFVGLFFSVDFLFELLNKKSFTTHKPLFYLIEGAVLFQILGLIPHYELFIKKQDKQIVYSTIISLIFFIVFSSLLVPLYGTNGVASSLLLTFLMLFIMKIHFTRVTKVDERNS